MCSAPRRYRLASEWNSSVTRPISPSNQRPSGHLGLPPTPEEKLGDLSRRDSLPPLIQCPAQGTLHLSRELRWCWASGSTCHCHNSKGSVPSVSWAHRNQGGCCCRAALAMAGAARGGERAREQRAGAGLPPRRTGMCVEVWLTQSPGEHVT